MNLDEIVKELDTFFSIRAFPPDMPFSKLIPATYEGTGIDLEAVLEGPFRERAHGLMIRNAQGAGKIFLAVFLGDEIAGRVAAKSTGESLLICHHPLVMETSGRGFLPLSEASLNTLREGRISVYILHTPLDVHEEVSTSNALAREIGLNTRAPFCEVPGGSAGVHGPLSAPTSFDVLLNRVREASGVPDVNFIKKHERVQTLAVIGGGVDADNIQEAAALGCDVLVTGTYENQVQNEIGRRYREAFLRIRDALRISLVECSHYGSEAVVMQKDMVRFCTSRFGLASEYVPQEDPWY
ncbi:MAG: Nif3-like dinuclear metal center hexameric protein [Planctomycetota bacterium]|jgi:putative NIF3 family GTP cyclohydrolase 1 type 2